MPRPLIGLNCGLDAARPPRAYVNQDYVRAVESAGGIPVLLPPLAEPSAVRELLGHLDGVLFTGGPDLDPKTYRARAHPKTVRAPAAKETFDWALAERCAGGTRPVLGICYGLQLLNVVRGGSLVQHIPAGLPGALPHQSEKGPLARHSVSVASGSRLARLLGRRSAVVNSSHHQAVRRTGRGFRVAAVAPDGVIEALEDPKHPFLVAVQWHPERMQDDPAQRALLRHFVQACGRAMRRRL